MATARRLIALVCVAVIVLSAVTPDSSGLAWAILVPFWFFVATVAAVPIRREPDAAEPQPLPFLAALSPRAPPLGF